MWWYMLHTYDSTLLCAWACTCKDQDFSCPFSTDPSLDRRSHTELAPSLSLAVWLKGSLKIWLFVTSQSWSFKHIQLCNAFFWWDHGDQNSAPHSLVLAEQAFVPRSPFHRPHLVDFHTRLFQPPLFLYALHFVFSYTKPVIQMKWGELYMSSKSQ